MFRVQCSFLLCLTIAVQQSLQIEYTWDPNGYVFFCLCMGRIGNQMEHFLGGLAFAKQINRTLVLPPFRTYKNVPFSDWFNVDAVAKFHRVIPADVFMEQFAETHWPKGSRYGFCWLPSGHNNRVCGMKEGNPFGPFWDGLGVDFDDYVIYHISYFEYYANKWQELYPGAKYPVIAMKGAPASFPIRTEHRQLQRYMQFSEQIEVEAIRYITENFKGQTFVGIHLRNGEDWKNTCRWTHDLDNLMASPQCLDDTSQKLKPNMCLPSTPEVLRLLKKVVVDIGATVVFVATDRDPLFSEIQQHLAEQKVTVFHKDPWLPLDDWAVLIKSDHFIGNCVSSFTSFVKRARDVQHKPSSFWGFS